MSTLTFPANGYRCYGPIHGPNGVDSNRVFLCVQEFLVNGEILDRFIRDYSKSQNLSIITDFVNEIDRQGQRILAIKLSVTCNSSSITIPTTDFINSYFEQSVITPSNSWSEWQCLGVHPSYQIVYDLLCNLQPKAMDNIDTMTIVSHDGFIIYSIFGTTAILSPSQVIASSEGSLWQLSHDGTQIRQCTTSSCISINEIYHSFHHFAVQNAPNQFPTSPTIDLSSTNNRDISSPPALKLQKLNSSDANTTSNIINNSIISHETNDIHALNDVLHQSCDMEIDIPIAEHVTKTSSYNIEETESLPETTTKSSCNSSETSNPTTASATESSFHVNFSDKISNTNTSSIPTSNNMETSSTSSNDNPPSIPSSYYKGPCDKVIVSSTIIISGFSRSISKDGEIAKATHALMNASKIKHLLTPETNKNIQPEFPIGKNFGGYFPLGTSKPYDFCRYPANSDQKQLLTQVKHLIDSDNANYYHQVFAFAVSVSPQDFRAARVIGAFRGVIPNSNLIPVQIQELHKTVFQSDPKIILFPNVIGTNIAGTHDAKILHETVIMVKSLHKISTTDMLHKYKLKHGKGMNVYPVELIFYNDLSTIAVQLKTRPNICPPSSVVIRHAEPSTPFDVLSVIDKLKNDSSLPWDDISAILPMDFTSKSAKAIEVSYLSWHPTNHVVVIHKDGSDQRSLQQSLNQHLQSHYDRNTLVAKNERHLPGCLDRVFRKYAGINTNQPQQTNVWNSANALRSSTTVSRSWANVAKSNISSSHLSDTVHVTSSPTAVPTMNSSSSNNTNAINNDYVTDLQTIIRQQTTIINSLEQRINALETQLQPSNQLNLIETAVTTAVNAIVNRFEDSIQRQNNLFMQLMDKMLDRKGGALPPSFTPTNIDVTKTATIKSILSHHVYNPSSISSQQSIQVSKCNVETSTNLFTESVSDTSHWLSESTIFSVIQSKCTSPCIPSALIVESDSLSNASLQILKNEISNISSTSPSHLLGIVFVGNRHWQPIVIYPQLKTITLWDVKSSLQLNSQHALHCALPNWSIVIETLPAYTDGDCGIVAIDILLAISHQLDWKSIDFTQLHLRRVQLQLPTQPTCNGHSHQMLGGSISNTHTTTPTSSILSCTLPSQNLPTQNPNVIPSTCDPILHPTAHPIRYHDNFHNGHSIIGTLEGTDIRMATLNINSLHDDKIPFLAWLFIKYKLDILAIQDTRISRQQWFHTQQYASSLFPSNTMFLHSPPLLSENTTQRLIGGVALCISARCCNRPNFRTDPLQCGAICGYSFATPLGRLMIINTYFPNKPVNNTSAGPGSLWAKIVSRMPNSNSCTPIQYLQSIADKWSALEEASAGTFLMGDLNSSVIPNGRGGCHNIQE